MKIVKQLSTIACIGLFTCVLGACSEEKQEQTEESMSKMKGAASEMMDDAKNAASDLADKTEDFAEDAADKAEDWADDAGNAIEDNCEKMKEKMDLEDKDC
ncbi:hypothetical protein [Alteromonas confluentis]|uniref:Late embryogenesis abundant protein n=1 Tax=Alteromonas confluentis TaxID=1656094 RepID=A0A1E7Z567_9ALTE|nr:hypothetical protein [Alteromonas confluentis]OFC68665.1 hypothetical protein BFC18_01020 [Alteromonas confluentis]